MTAGLSSLFGEEPELVEFTFLKKHDCHCMYTQENIDMVEALFDFFPEWEMSTSEQVAVLSAGAMQLERNDSLPLTQWQSPFIYMVKAFSAARGWTTRYTLEYIFSHTCSTHGEEREYDVAKCVIRGMRAILNYDPPKEL